MAATEPLYIRRIRTGVVQRSQFFGMCLGNLILVPDESVETAETDGVYLWYNPTFVEYLYENDFEGACWLFAHEAFHAASNHPLRVGNRELKLANVAADYVDNGEIERGGFTAPKNAKIYRDRRFDGMSFERAYNVLDRERQQGGDGQQPQQGQQGQQGNQPGQGQPGQGQPQAGGQQPGQQPGGQNGQQSPQGGQQGQGKGQPGQGQPGQGQGQDGSGRPGQDIGDIGGGGCFVRPRNPDGSALTPMDESKLRTQWEIVVQHARMVSDRIGTAPGTGMQLVHEIHVGKTDWVDETRRFFRKISEAKYSWLRPDRRFRPLYIPARMTPQMGEIVIVGDTSGSVSERQWVTIASEMRSLVKEVNPKRVHVVFNDAEIHETREYEQADYDDIDFTRKGFGGTKVQPVFNWIEQQGINPACMLFYTDLEIDDFPDQEPDYPVLWCSVKKPFAPWGDIVMLDEI